MNKRTFFFGIIFLLILTHVQAQQPPLPDFEVDDTSITFSNPSPIEGEELTIFVRVKNIGQIEPTRNEDIVVNLYEDDPATNPLQILCKDVILSLKPGSEGTVKAQWRPGPGATEVYAVVNPSGDKLIQESDRSNNVTHTTITATSRTFPQATPEAIQAAIQKGAAWLKTQQGKHSRTCLQCGTENQLISICVICGATLKGLPENLIPGPAWDFGEDNKQETALGLQALLAAGLPTSDTAVKSGLNFLMAAEWNLFDVYHHAVIIPTFVATNDPKYRQRAQFAINKLVENQLPVKGSEFRDPRDDGGWGYGYTADGAHMNMVLYALYAGKQWGLDIPQQTWERAEQWIRRNQTETGGWLYNLVDEGSPWAIGVYGSMTATGLWALRACGVPPNDPQIQKGLEWVRKYWSITRNPGSFSWKYYYLLSLQRFADIPSELDTLVGHDWYQKVANMLISEQQPDGRWVDAEGDFTATCFAVMFLTRTLPRPTLPNLGAVEQTLRVSPPAPRVGEPTRISVTLTNTGAPLDKIITVDFYDGKPKAGGVKLSSQEVIFTPNLRETTASMTWAPRSEGKHELYIVVDPEAQVEDLNRGNNVISQSLTIRPKSAAAIDPTQAIRKISDGVYQIGDVIADVNRREVVINGEINIVSGDTIIEFFACGILGKTHESLIMLNAEPIHIQLALLRLNMDAGMNLTVEGDPHDPKGSPAELWVEWERSGETIRRRAEELVWNAMEDRPMERTHWIFTGGRIINNQFTPQLYHNIIATYRDPDSIFNHPLPGGTDDRTYHVNTDKVPPKGTKVRVIIRAV